MLLADLSALLGSQEPATGSKRPPIPKFKQSPAAPRLEFRRFNTHILCQNVAGLWLKYGAKPAKIEASWRPKIKLHDATIC
jgi:hypothetical protein